MRGRHHRRAVAENGGTLRRAMLTCVALSVVALAATAAAAPAPAATAPDASGAEGRGSLTFAGPAADAALFSRQVAANLDGVLQHTFEPEARFVPQINATLPAGYVSASLPGKPWSFSMWPRDGGAFLREAIAWGDLATARLNAGALLELISPNAEGFYALPEHFDGVTPAGTLTAEEGTAALVVNLVSLWMRLGDGDPVRARVEAFLCSERAPTAYWLFKTSAAPSLVPGSGEFGFGAGNPAALVYNVVQNAAVARALLAAAEFAGAVRAGEGADEGSAVDACGVAPAAELRGAAASVRGDMLRHLVNKTDGGWVWAINTSTLTVTPDIGTSIYNVGFAGVNEALAVGADGVGADWLPLSASGGWAEGADAGRRAFARLATTPLRAELFRASGVFAQFDLLNQFAGVPGGLPGHATSAYGQDYATHVMLLSEDLAAAGRAAGFLANTTAVGGQTLSPLYFYERMQWPWLKGMAQVGCGELNLVGAVAPAKTARLMLGVDDSAPSRVLVLPRLPPGWTTAEATMWPVLVGSAGAGHPTLVRANVTVSADAATGGAARVSIAASRPIPLLCIRLGVAGRFVWHNRTNVTRVSVAL